MTPSDYASLLAATAGRALGDLGERLGGGMAEALPPAGITTPLRLAHFLGQTCEETGGFKWFAELGGPDYFARYDGRADLGNSQPGDGFRFRGRGPLMLTGRANYAKYGEQLGVDLLSDPDAASDPVTGMVIAAAYWTDHGLNDLADQDNAVAITRRINGGLNGLDQRVLALKRAKAAIAALGPAQTAPPDAPEPAPAPPAPQPLPAQPTPPEATPEPSQALADDASDLPSLLRLASRHFATMGLGAAAMGSAMLAYAQAHPIDTALLALTALLLVVAGLWLASRFAHQHRADVAKALATPPPGLPPLSADDIAKIIAALRTGAPAAS